GHGSPPNSNATDSNPSGECTPTADGVCVNTLTCSATNKSWKSSGEPTTHSGTTTSRPPPSSAAQISHTEKSKAYEWHCVQTCSIGRAAGVGFAGGARVGGLMGTPLGVRGVAAGGRWGGTSFGGR